MENVQSPRWLLYCLERKGIVCDETARLREFMEACCQNIVEFLPPEAEHWLNVARAYRLGQAATGQLEAVRVAACEHLGSDSCDVRNPNVAAVRALICLLFPDDWEYRENEPTRIGLFESLDCFLTYANTVVDRHRDQARLLLEIFPELTEEVCRE